MLTVPLAAHDDAVARGESLPWWRCPSCYRLTWTPIHWWGRAVGWCRL